MRQLLGTLVESQLMRLLLVVLAFIGYSCYWFKYALVFAIFSGLANLIPYVGPSIGLIPMIIANVFTDPHRS